MIGKRLFRFVIAMLLLIGTPTLSGCWDIKDINHRALPILMGLKSTDRTYQIFLLIPEATQSETKIRVVTETGPTINGVIDQISKNMEKQVDLLHLKVIVFERSFAERGLGDSISSFMRARDIPNKTLAAISDGDLEPLFEKLGSSSANGGTEIYNYFEKNAGWTPHVAQARIWQIFRSLHSYTRDVVVPLITPGRTTTIESTGSAIIKNGRMAGRISSEETLLYNMFNGSGTQGKIEVMDHATVQIKGSRLSQKSEFQGSKAVMNSRLNLKVTVLETRGSPSAAMVKHELSELLTLRFHKLFRTIQSKKADILGIGQFFRARIPRDRLQHWRTDYFPSMKLNLQVNVIIESEGLLKMKSQNKMRAE